MATLLGWFGGSVGGHVFSGDLGSEQTSTHHSLQGTSLIARAEPEAEMIACVNVHTLVVGTSPHQLERYTPVGTVHWINIRNWLSMLIQC